MVEISQELYFEVCRLKQHYFLTALNTDNVNELKRKLMSILKTEMDKLEVWKLDENDVHHILSDAVTLTECGYNPNNAKSEMPAQLGLRLIGEDTRLTIHDVSFPPPLADVLEDAPVQRQNHVENQQGIEQH